MITIKRKVSFRRVRRSRKAQSGSEAGSTPAGRIPRVARLMALAIRFDQLIRDGVVADQAELARLGHVTRARLTQIMNLLALAPDIQQHLLVLSSTGGGTTTSAHRCQVVLEPATTEVETSALWVWSDWKHSAMRATQRLV